VDKVLVDGKAAAQNPADVALQCRVEEAKEEANLANGAPLW
jgi:hypothetical protein